MTQSSEWPSWPVYGDEERDAICRVLATNQLFAAEEVRAFEQEFAQYAGAPYARALGNATQGLHLVLAALDIGVNDEVIVSPYTWISSASCILMQNAVPVFADCEEESLGLSAEAVERAITPRTKAVILVHMFGYPADSLGIREVCRNHDIHLIEDTSHGHGAYVGDTHVGNFGSIGVFSLHQRKTLSVGDGGIIITHDPEIDQRIYRLRSFGHDELSYNYRMTEFSAAIGRVRLKTLDAENAIRRRNAEHLAELMSGVDGVDVRLARAGTTGVYYRVLLEYASEAFTTKVGDFVNALCQQGVPFETTWEPLHRHPHFNLESDVARGRPWKWDLYEGRDQMPDQYQDLSFPCIERFCDLRGFELAIHPPVGPELIERAADVLKTTLAKTK